MSKFLDEPFRAAQSKIKILPVSKMRGLVRIFELVTNPHHRHLYEALDFEKGIVAHGATVRMIREIAPPEM